MNKVLVTGATGLVGAHLLYALTKKKIPVRALKRPGASVTYLSQVFQYYDKNASELLNQIEWAEGDVTDVPSLEEAMQGISHVFHCAALVAFHKKYYTQLDKTNSEGTANVINIALDSEVKKLVHVSSIAAIGKLTTENGLLNENSAWKYSKQTSRYSLSKYNAEREIWRGNEEGLSCVMVNPGVIIGPCDWNKNTGTFFKNVYNGLKYYTPGSTGFVDVRDVVKAMMLLMESDVEADRFILVGANRSYKDFLGEIASVMEKKPPYKRASKFLMNWARRWESIAGKISNREPRITRETARSAFNNYAFNGNRITEQTGLQYTPLHETLSNTWGFIQRFYAR